MQLCDVVVLLLEPCTKQVGEQLGELSTALADLDGDGDLELIHFSITELNVWDLPNPGPLAPRVEWGQWRHDPRRSNTYHNVMELEASPNFLRGDCNGDGTLSFVDAFVAIAELFENRPRPCPARSDVDHNRVLDIRDPLFLLSYLYTGGAAPDGPFPNCDRKPVDEYLPCLPASCP